MYIFTKEYVVDNRIGKKKYLVIKLSKSEKKDIKVLTKTINVNKSQTCVNCEHMHSIFCNYVFSNFKFGFGQPKEEVMQGFYLRIFLVQRKVNLCCSLITVLKLNTSKKM